MGQTISAVVVNPNATKSNWLSDNPVVPNGALVVELSTNPVTSPQIKIGDGVTAYTSLPYFSPASGGGTGQYLGIATNATSPPSGISDFAYYITVSTGTFTNLSNTTLPSTSLLGIITYNPNTEEWIAVEVLDSSIIEAQTLQEVTDAGAYTNTPFGLQQTGGSQESVLTQFEMVQSGTPLAGAAQIVTNSDGTATVALFSRNGGQQAAVVFISAAGMTNIFQGTVTGNRVISYPDASGVVALMQNATTFTQDFGSTYKTVYTDNKISIIRKSDSLVMMSMDMTGVIAPTPVFTITDIATGNSAFILSSGIAANGQGYYLPQYRGGEFALAGRGVNPTTTINTAGYGTGGNAIVFLHTNDDDASGVLVLKTGTGCQANKTILTVTYATSYPIKPPRVLLSPAQDAVGNVVNVAPDVLNNTNTFFNVLSTQQALNDNTTYYITYMIVK